MQTNDLIGQLIYSIDFILVYKASDNPNSDSQKMRDSFEASLIGMGVELELQDKEVTFL